VKRLRVIARGRVQGVFFRDSVRRLAARLGVAGWVHNRADGSIEAVFEGDAGAVEELVAFCREGPPGARVEAVDVAVEEPQGERGFTVR